MTCDYGLISVQQIITKSEKMDDETDKDKNVNKKQIPTFSETLKDLKQRETFFIHMN